MANRYFDRVIWLTLLYAFGLFNLFLYLALAIQSGSFFKKRTEQDILQLSIARDQFWNLAKSPLPGFVHRFFALRNGRQLHYIVNDGLDGNLKTNKNLVVLIHGWPDSSMLWLPLLDTESGKSLTKNTNVVCLDLPGIGGSDSFEHYGPEDVLEALTEFIVAMKEEYTSDEKLDGKTFIVGHDWGCVLSYRLAAEAPILADRFILTNGPHVELALANKDRLTSSSFKIFKQFRQSPRKNYPCLAKSIDTLKPLAYQILLFGYIAAFQLPSFMVKYLGTGGNYAFLRGAHRAAVGKDKSEYKPMESMARTLGPSVEECKTRNHNEKSTGYGKSVLERAKHPGLAFYISTSYYRDGVGMQPWSKSLETIADLHNIEASQNRPRHRRSSSASGALFNEPYKGSLRAPSTIIWGKRDQACTQAICLDGIGDYLAKDSEVILLPRTGHWTAVERESREALAKVIKRYSCGNSEPELGEVERLVRVAYEDATLFVRK